MALDKHHLPDREPGMDVKRVYNQPKLIRYGLVRDLTQNGTVAVTEGNNDGNMGSIKGSSILIKENIVKVGCHPLGFGLYVFDYKPEFRDQCGQGRQFGVLAEEVEKVVPDAVGLHSNGYKAVNYSMLGIVHTVH